MNTTRRPRLRPSNCSPAPRPANAPREIHEVGAALGLRAEVVIWLRRQNFAWRVVDTVSGAVVAAEPAWGWADAKLAARRALARRVAERRRLEALPIAIGLAAPELSTGLLRVTESFERRLGWKAQNVADEAACVVAPRKGGGRRGFPSLSYLKALVEQYRELRDPHRAWETLFCRLFRLEQALGGAS